MADDDIYNSVISFSSTILPSVLITLGLCCMLFECLYSSKHTQFTLYNTKRQQTDGYELSELLKSQTILLQNGTFFFNNLYTNITIITLIIINHISTTYKKIYKTKRDITIGKD